MPEINLSYLEKISELVSDNDYFQRKTKPVRNSKGKKVYTYQYYNQICTCILRIRETSAYLEDYPFEGNNKRRQAFDFYGFVNCASIVFGCAEELFKIFDLTLNSYSSRRAFLNSCPRNISDIEFFKFLSSASSMHPANTDRHRNVTKHVFEVYPYALWCKDSIMNVFFEVPKWADIELLSLNAKTKGKYKRYYVSIDEIYAFINNCTSALKVVYEKMENLLASHKEAIKCKRLLTENSFNTYAEYLLYLRKRLLRHQPKDEPADGGLLLASFVVENDIISDEFKEYIKGRVALLITQMKTDIKQISYDDIFNELNLSDVIGNCERGGYKSQKFHDYLYEEAIDEIEKKNYVDFRGEGSEPISNRYFSVCLLIEIKDYLYPNEEFERARSYADLYAITLQRIFEMKKEQ